MGFSVNTGREVTGPWRSHPLFNSRVVIRGKTRGQGRHSVLSLAALVRNHTATETKGSVAPFQNNCSPQDSPSSVTSDLCLILFLSGTHNFGRISSTVTKLDFPQPHFVVIENYPGSCSPASHTSPMWGCVRALVLLCLFFPAR